MFGIKKFCNAINLFSVVCDFFPKKKAEVKSYTKVYRGSVLVSYFYENHRLCKMCTQIFASVASLRSVKQISVPEVTKLIDLL